MFTMNPVNMSPLHPKIIQSTMFEIWARLASTLATFMFMWTMIKQFLPYQFNIFLEKTITNLYSNFHPYIEVTIPDHSGDRLKRSEAYIAVQSYLSSLSSNSAKRFTGELALDGTSITLSMDEYQKVDDNFKGARIWWVSGKSISSPNSRGIMSYGGGHNSSQDQDRRYYKVTFHQKHRELITGEYLKHVVKQGKEIRVKNRQRRLYTNTGASYCSIFAKSMWSYIHFEHPSTFETLAMELKKKKEIMDDLDKFTKSKEYYERIGKAWKRGYLLFGPPGTGKSTMIAAMANYLKYDVYDLELTAVKDNTELRRLLIETTSKSIIVIEDIDCSLDLTGPRKKKENKAGETEDEEVGKEKSSKEKEKYLDHENVYKGGSKVTLSGLLNFIDGIWSSCGGERIIVFTTNYVEKLDPALIRKGRMDKHVEMSFCGFEGFKVLAKNYLYVEEHALFEDVRRLLTEVEITPADVAENLMPKSFEQGVDECLRNLVAALRKAKDELAGKRIQEGGNVIQDVEMKDDDSI